MRIIKDASLEDITRELRRMLNDGIASPEVRTAAINAMQEDNEITSIFNWAKANFRYVADPYGKERFCSPAKLLEQLQEQGFMAEDCDSAALLMASLAGSIGYEVRLGLIDCDFDNELDHAIASVRVSDGWLDLDLTLDKPMGWVEQYWRREDIYV